MTDPAGELTGVVHTLARRRRRAQAVRLMLRILRPVVPIAALAVVAMHFDLVSPSSVVTCALVGLAAIAVVMLVGLLRSVDDVAEAKRLDDALGLKDRLASALSFLRNPEPTPFERAAILDARGFVPQVRARGDGGVPLRRPLARLAVAAVAALLLVAGVHLVRGLPGGADEETQTPGAARAAVHDDTPGDETPETPTDTSDDDLVEVENVALTEESTVSAFTDAERAQMAALAASETSEADRLLQQAAYLDEMDLDDSGLGRDGTSDDDDRVTMKEPDMDMIREMVKEAQKRRKEGKEQDRGSDDINLEVLIKRHAAASTKRPPKPPGGRRSSSGGGGPSQDTRIKPRRVKVDARVAFKITSVRSLTPAGASRAKRIVLSEAIMRTSGVPQPPLVEPRAVRATSPRVEPTPVVTQPVPAELRTVISKYFEGLRQLKKAP